MRSATPVPRILVLGGARSGKSGFAEQFFADEPQVVYAATAPRYEDDPEWAERVNRHRERRPDSWLTHESGSRPQDLAEMLRVNRRPVLIDSLTLWLTAAMDEAGAWDEAAWRDGDARARLAARTDELTSAFAQTRGPVVAVSDEIGFGVVPESAGTRRFRDELGRLNQAFAAAADEVWLVVAGLPLKLKDR
ncbi:MAG TPA: bifunctional adenosylcobinamide kinase/adenosylcobinamide-phosphate guanylyltransferase [Actinocrinis sp.]|nr:bifunctional adenosylcobinamide kinase/adenosylcobinamide-phosphate guanylyltransferase [Actinocrinis sp.]